MTLYLILGGIVIAVGVTLTIFFQKKKIENLKKELESKNRSIKALQNEIAENEKNIQDLKETLRRINELEKEKCKIKEEIFGSNDSSFAVIDRSNSV